MLFALLATWAATSQSPSNDECGSAIELSWDVPQVVELYQATVSSPLSGCFDPGSGGAVYGDVWCHFVASCFGEATVEVAPVLPTVVEKLTPFALYRGSCGSEAEFLCESPSLPAHFVFEVTPGEHYWVRIGSLQLPFPSSWQRVSVQLASPQEVPGIEVQRIPSMLPYQSYLGSDLDAHSGRVLVGSSTLATAGVPPQAQLFERTPQGTLVQIATLIPNGVGELDGMSVVVDLFEEYAFLGVEGADTAFPEAGAVFVFQRAADGSWPQVARILAPDAAPGERFGNDLHFDGHTLVVGAHGASPPEYAGAVYVFVPQPDGTWTPTARLVAPNQHHNYNFGEQVRVDRDLLLCSEPATNSQMGSVHVFRWHETSFWQYWGIVGFADPLPAYQYKEFGRVMDFEGGVVALTTRFKPGGSPPAAYDSVLVAKLLDSHEWEMQSIIDILNPSFSRIALDLDGDRLLIGNGSDDGQAPAAGALSEYYRQSSGDWVLHAMYRAAPAEAQSTLGSSASFLGSQVVAGAPGLNGAFDSSGGVFLLAQDALRASAQAISLQSGGAVHFDLQPGHAHANKIYLLLGSATGTLSTRSCPPQLPLVEDAYYATTLALANQGPFVSTLGVLDAQAYASAKLSVSAASDPGLAGITLQHAFAVFDPLDLSLDFASNPVSLALVP